MPKDLETGEVTCINKCGPMERAETRWVKETLSGYAHFMDCIEVERQEDHSPVINETSGGLPLEVLVCPKCLYAEMYVLDLGQIEETPDVS
jgi:hypothetical protein